MVVILTSTMKPVVVVASPAKANVILAATQGPPGPAGPAGEAVSTTTLTAAETIPGYTAVALGAGGEAEAASSADPTQQGAVIGIATGGAVSGAQVTVQYAGPISYNGWNWTLNEPVFLGPGGVLTQTPPTSGFLQAMGIPLNATTLLVRIEAAIAIE